MILQDNKVVLHYLFVQHLKIAMAITRHQITQFMLMRIISITAILIVLQMPYTLLGLMQIFNYSTRLRTKGIMGIKTMP